MGRVVECNDVSIRYITGDLKAIGLKEYVMRKITGNYSITEFWADKHISFTLESGDMLGIIGTNGAGKSTLLKAISGIMEPKQGSIKVNGRIAALLELASGFDGDMTVKENAYLRGAMLGYTRAFMDEMYEEIIAFAELEDFEDRPFRQLSSGMKSRLGFAICCMVDPDIIILDEVLAVGDGSFRKKSGDKMREILSSGVTGILVSHSVDQICELCNKVLWLDRGNQIAFSSEVTKVCNAYQEYLITKELPSSDTGIGELAISYEKRTAEKRAIQNRKETKRLEGILSKGTKNTAIEAALDIIENNAPEMLDMHEVGEWRRKNNG